MVVVKMVAQWDKQYQSCYRMRSIHCNGKTIRWVKVEIACDSMSKNAKIPISKLISNTMVTQCQTMNARNNCQSWHPMRFIYCECRFSVKQCNRSIVMALDWNVCYVQKWKISNGTSIYCKSTNRNLYDPAFMNHFHSLCLLFFF